MTSRMALVAAALPLSLAASAAFGQVVDINGGSSWSGWQFRSNSATAGVWTQGSTTRNFNIYTSLFTLNAGQTVGGSRLANGEAGDGVRYTGNTQADLFSGSWQAGDSIVGVGIQHLSGGLSDTMFVKFDFGGDNYFAASSVGAADGLFQSGAGDVASQLNGIQNSSQRWLNNSYAIFSGPETFIRPYGDDTSGVAPGRGFAILGAGNQVAASSMQFFFNLSAMLRGNGGAGYGEGTFGPLSKVGVYEELFFGTPDFSGHTLSIPAPGAIALLGLAGIAVRRRGR